jgi:hypothetical protein
MPHCGVRPTEISRGGPSAMNRGATQPTGWMHPVLMVAFRGEKRFWEVYNGPAGTASASAAAAQPLAATAMN